MVRNHGDDVAMARSGVGVGRCELVMSERSGSTRAPVGLPRGFECGDGPGGAMCVCVSVCVCWGGGGSSVHEGNFAQSRRKQCLFTSLLLQKWA